MTQLILLEKDEFNLRLDKVRREMAPSHTDAILVSDNAALYYLTGRVYSGYAYIPATGHPLFFVKRPVTLGGDFVQHIRKPEQIAETIGLNVPATIGLELSAVPYSAIIRLKNIFPQAAMTDATAMLSAARAVKTPFEIEKITMSGIRQERVYRRVPHLFQEGMTDIELQVDIERTSRLEGCLGQFRISGNDMELYMGNVLVGENADIPTPYDFAMGGEGLDPSLPVGCNGTVIREKESVMVDVNGNFTGYMTDMTRVFAVGSLPQEAIDAHQCSIDICRMFEREALPGVEAKALYEKALEMVKARGLEAYFMGHRQHAGFIGHGVGIEINELPVIAPRSKHILEVNNVIALEPKFVIPGTGAVGIENTYVITPSGAHCLTNAPEEIRTLE